MNQRIKNNWTTALRSGDYKQGQDALRMDGCFCCLGVLVDIYGIEKKEAWGSEAMQNDGLPSKAVRLWSGLSQHIFVGRLAAMNDLEGKSFEEIADFIEEEL